MSIGAHITTGEKLVPLEGGLMDTLVELRVEQEMDKPARFALRFEEEICDGQPVAATSKDIQPGTQIGIFAPDENRLVCLVLGPITRVRNAAQTGGVGNWHEVHGLDRRAVMDRVEYQAAYEGRASDAVTQLLAGYGFEPAVEETRRIYDSKSNKLTQRSSDLKFIEQIAARNNMYFWISYETTPSGLSAPKVRVTETAHMAASPPRNIVPLLPPVLSVDDAKVTLRVSPPGEECPNVTRFEAEIDYERPNAAQGFTQDPQTGETTDSEASAKDTPASADRKGPAEIDAIMRKVLTPTDSDPITTELAAEAEVTDAAWFVSVECSANVAQLGAVVMPHDIVNVANVDARLVGSYQVTKTLHVIRAEAHMTDFTIRANGLTEVA